MPGRQEAQAGHHAIEPTERCQGIVAGVVARHKEGADGHRAGGQTQQAGPPPGQQEETEVGANVRGSTESEDDAPHQDGAALPVAGQIGPPGPGCRRCCRLLCPHEVSYLYQGRGIVFQEVSMRPGNRCFLVQVASIVRIKAKECMWS